MRYFGRLLLYLAIFFVTLSVSSVLIARFIPITVTPLKVIRVIENFPDKGLSVQSNWCSLAHINPVMPCAVIATEDNNFMVHNVSTGKPSKKLTTKTVKEIGFAAAAPSLNRPLKMSSAFPPAPGSEKDLKPTTHC